MKFTINREELIGILSEYTNILKEIANNPLLAGLKIKAIENKIIFTGVNLEVEYIKEIVGNVTEVGEILIKPTLLLEYIKLLDEENLDFSSNNGFITVHYAEFSILEDENFPVVNKFNSQPLLTIEGKTLVQIFEKVKFAASQSSNELETHCVRGVFKTDELNLITTNSYRLVFLRNKVNCIEEREVSIPMDTVNIICKLLKEYEKEVTIGYNGNILIFNWENSYFSSKTIALDFPAFENLLQNLTFSKKMEFNREELKSALKKAITVTKTNLNTKFGATFEFTGDTTVIKGIAENAKIKQKVKMIKEGEDFTASINCKFLAEYIDNIEKNVIINGTDGKSAFKIEEDGNKDYICVLAPVSIN